MGLNLKNARNEKTHILLESKGLTLQRLFPYTSSYSFKNLDCHKISFFNDGVLKLGHFGILTCVFSFPVFVKL